MAKKKTAAPAAEGSVKARVLTACVINGEGYKADDIAVIDAKAVEFHKALGHIDDHPDAVEYAESLGAGSDAE